MTTSSRRLLAVFFGLWTLGTAPGVARAAGSLESAQRFLSDFPDARISQSSGRISRVYGTPFGYGDSARASADAFVQTYAGMFGVRDTNLTLSSLGDDDQLAQPVLYDRGTGQYKFTLFHYTQQKEGIPVFRTDLRLLVRNEPGYPLVWVGSTLRDLSGFSPVLDLVDSGAAEDQARAAIPDLVNFSDAELVIWAGVDDMVVTPAVALAFIGDNGLPATGEYAKWLFVADAASGEILYQENMIVHTDVTGNVSGNATQGLGADICGPEELTPMPYAQVSIVGGSTAYADENGDFVIPNGGSSQVTVRSSVQGRWFDVNNQAGSDTVLEQNVTPPGPADFIHNESNTSEYRRAEVNGYVQANVIRDYVLSYNPSYPVIANQTGFRVNVNIASTCNAYYDGPSINFFRSGGGCPNTAFSTVVHHEYGHHLVAVAGSGQGAYGEGMGDAVGVLITDNSGLAYGFTGNCNVPLRNADNTCQYQETGCSSCGNESHACGRLLSGCVWSLREELVVTNPDTYRDILSDLAINSILLHGGGDSSITPEITIDFLTLDDDDADLNNGTPHWFEICDAFGAHNMACPPLKLLEFEYPDGLPELLTPDQETTVRVNVLPFSDNPVPGTGTVTYRIDGGAFQEVNMTELAPNEYEASLPAAPCGSLVEYYFAAQAECGLFSRDPVDAPDSTYGAMTAHALVIAVDDTLETDQGWTVGAHDDDATMGIWERVDPVGTSAQPEDDHTPDPGVLCYVTDGRGGDNNDYDVDGGKTTLFTPVFDLTTAGEAVISYWRWFDTAVGFPSSRDDVFVVDVSNDAGVNWINVETIGPRDDQSVGGWLYHEFNLTDFVEPTSSVQLRFIASDTNRESTVEAAIDDLTVLVYDCAGPCDGDLDGDGQTGQSDLGILLSDWGCTGSNCVGDLDGDGQTGQSDLGILLADWGCGS